VGARLEGDVYGRVSRALTRVLQGIHLGVRVSATMMESFSDDYTVVDDYGSDEWIGTGPAGGLPSQLERARHVRFVHPVDRRFRGSSRCRCRCVGVLHHCSNRTRVRKAPPRTTKVIDTGDYDGERVGLTQWCTLSLRPRPLPWHARPRLHLPAAARSGAMNSVVETFSHPDFNCRPRNLTGSAVPKRDRSRALTAGGEFHPAPKVYHSTIRLCEVNVKPKPSA